MNIRALAVMTGLAAYLACVVFAFIINPAAGIGALLVAPFSISLVARVAKKGEQRQAGHGRCAYCNTRLKAIRGTYAATCRKCGRTQPWAQGT